MFVPCACPPCIYRCFGKPRCPHAFVPQVPALTHLKALVFGFRIALASRAVEVLGSAQQEPPRLHKSDCRSLESTLRRRAPILRLHALLHLQHTTSGDTVFRGKESSAARHRGFVRRHRVNVQKEESRKYRGQECARHLVDTHDKIRQRSQRFSEMTSINTSYT